MRSKFKPPVTNWLLIKYIKYNTLNVKKKDYSLNLLFVKVKELNLCYFWILQNNISCFSIGSNKSINWFFCNLSLLLFPLDSTRITTKLNSIEKLLQIQLNSLKINTIQKKKYKNFPFFDSENFFFWPIFLKDKLFNFKWELNQFFLENIFSNENIFLFNFFYSFIFVKILSEKKINFSKKKLKLIFYNFDYLTLSLVTSKYDNIFKKYNWYLTIQKGFLKNTTFFLNWHYLLSTSTQNYNLYKYNLLKLFFIESDKKFNKNFNINNINQKMEGIYIWDWRLPILPFYVNKLFYIYNGRRFTWIWILPAMVNRKFGEFSFTRKIHSWKLKLNFIFKNVE